MKPQVTPEAVLAWLPRLLLRGWRNLSSRARRIIWVSAGVPLVLFLTSGAAYAADGTTAPAALSWIQVKDSHGVSIWQYEMSIDRGGVRHPIRGIWAFCIDLTWQMYRGCIAVACWLIDWTLSMEWIQWVSKPVMNVSDALHQVVAHFGVTTAFLTIAAIVAALWIARGKWVLGLFELAMSMVIASLAVGILANPVRLVAGDDGLLVNTRDMGMSIAAGLQNHGDTSADPDQLRTEVTGMLAETFLRKPQQLVNFGTVIDDTSCEKEYDKTVKQGPYGDDDDLRDAMGDCKDELGEVAENPNAGMFMSQLVLLPAGLVAVIFAAILCGVVLVAGIYALFLSLKMIVSLVLALLPNAGRGSLWMTFAELVISMITIVFSIVFLAAYLMLLEAIFTSADGNPMSTFFVVDILMFIGVIVFWKGRSRLKEAASQLAGALSKRPGGGSATSLPRHNRFSPADIYYGGVMTAKAGEAAIKGAAGTYQAGKSAHGTYKDLSGRGVDGMIGLGRKLTGRGVDGDEGADADKGAGDSGGPDAGERLRDKLDQRSNGASKKGELLSRAVQIGAAAASGGTSAAAEAAARSTIRKAATNSAGKAASRQMLKNRLRDAQQKANTAQAAQNRGPSPASAKAARNRAQQPRQNPAAVKMRKRINQTVSSR